MKTTVAQLMKIGLPFKAFITLDGWHGRTSQVVTVVGETPKRYRIWNNSFERVALAGRNRWLESGAQTLVPKHAVSLTDRTA